MKLKKLEIAGFKSFALKTTLDFWTDEKKDEANGITAIVGPNGSGKSNVADALRWVMGEQSMKNLRGKKSEDIIFAGSGKKARLGSAWVTLYLDNSDKKIPLDFNEVAVTRKIYRSGESEYLINQSRVRLQDVVDILAKAGVGKESYAIINQGMADSILNASLADRRRIIEDAAGVKQYQIKKERAIRKLETTQQNLLRVKELTEEIKPHLRMLKHQAKKASQSKKVAFDLVEKQTKLFSLLWFNFQAEQEKLDDNKKQSGLLLMNAQREVDKLTDEIASEAKEEKINKEQEELEREQKKNREEFNQLERETIITEGRIEIEREKQKNIKIIEEIKIKSIAVDINYVRVNIDKIRKDQEKLIRRIERTEKIEDLQEIKEFARVIQQQLYALKNDIEKGKVEELPKEKAQEKISQTNIPSVNSQELIKLQEKVIQLKERSQKAREKVNITEQKIQKEYQLNRQKRQKFFELERTLRQRQEELNKLRDNFNEAKIALARKEVREEDLRNQVRNEIKKEAEELNPNEEALDRFRLESEIVKLKSKMEQIGGIDPMVIDEYNEVNERFEFLTTESQDLEKAMNSLKEIIGEMDSKIQKKFLITFEEINKEFSKYFKIIFGGGQSQLIKTKIKKPQSRNKNQEIEEDIQRDDNDKIENEESKEEIGIDISASPPGKKISSLSILSGGERSLTSLALLFAIISHNPPPFTILDEVEAALDEANSKRFGRILQELSGTTQFVTITHNRETMRQASMLYGVTMGEDGVSKILSVKLNQIGKEGRILK